MKIIAAYLSAVLGGNANPFAEDIRDILIKGKDINELLAVGREKLASVPAASSGAVTALPPPASRAAAEGKKEEEKVEEKEESDDDMIFSLLN
ncbi:hypothetical protein M9H77_12838 [Catharanthus roseus]|uniref:Uncharacterized protein n=1 Tax=Catharanthus roseus TaxID=4058 RepID=A0ACC0BIQ3_CATRO|nr:hypothetical protein M9H77_12838 [Catharanthus roseus]